MENISPAPQVPTVQPPAPSNRGLHVVIVILSLIIVAESVWILWPRQIAEPAPARTETPSPIVTASPTADPTAGWKIYMNEEYGFEFRHPLTLSVTNPGTDAGPVKNMFNVAHNFSIIIHENISIDEYWVRLFRESERPSDTLRQTVVVDGQNGFKWENIRGPLPNYGHTVIIVNKNNNLFAFNYAQNIEGKIGENEINESMLNQILATFRFK